MSERPWKHLDSHDGGDIFRLDRKTQQVEADSIPDAHVHEKIGRQVVSGQRNVDRRTEILLGLNTRIEPQDTLTAEHVLRTYPIDMPVEEIAKLAAIDRRNGNTVQVDRITSQAQSDLAEARKIIDAYDLSSYNYTLREVADMIANDRKNGTTLVETLKRMAGNKAA